MALLTKLKDLFLFIRFRYKDNSASGIIWFLNVVPSAVGFSIGDDSNRRFPLFWIIHFALVFYVYFFGGVVNSLKIAEDVGAIIKSYNTIFIIILIVNAGYWLLTTRLLVKSVLDNVIHIDTLFRKTEFLREKHRKLLTIVKRTVWIYYIVNMTDSITVYIPQRMILSREIFTAEPCAGLELTTTLNRHVCRSIIVVHDITVDIVVFNFQALLIFLIAHTAAMYLLLSEEMTSLNEYDRRDANYIQIRGKLSSIIKRHALILEIIRKLKHLYNIPLGVHFASNAACICLSFYLPLQQWITFLPVFFYCFLVFFLYCYLCQKLVNASEEFERAVYNCGWEKFHVNEKKTVLIILKIAQRPITMLAADMVPVNMHTFAITLQSMYKFITVVKF